MIDFESLTCIKMPYPLRDNDDRYMNDRMSHLSLTFNNFRQSTTSFLKRQEVNTAPAFCFCII